MQDLVRLLTDLLDRRATHLVVIVRRDFTEVDVHPAEVTALARDVEDSARLRVDRTFRAPGREVGVHEHAHDAPRVCGELSDVSATDRLAYAATRTTASGD